MTKIGAPDRLLLEAVREPFTAAPPDRIGVAVSGGGDSMALMHLLAEAFAGSGVTLHVATVDHGLRPESAAEAKAVARAAEHLGLSHETLTWTGWSGEGNLQDAARQARLRLLTGWAKGRGIPVLAQGHTADDQAETVLMRLSRGAGVDGLAAIPPRRLVAGITLVRPLLGVTRAELRDYLRRRGASWVEDPSNDDPRFERVRMRRALETLAPLGLTVTRLAEVAAQLGKAREALDWYSFLAAKDATTVDAGCILLDPRQFRTLPDEIARRLLGRALQWVGGGAYLPRRRPLVDLMAEIRRGRGMATLAGCRVFPQSGLLWIAREYGAVETLRVPVGRRWDRRWRAVPPEGLGDASALQIGPLGPAGLAECPNWRATGRPRAALVSTPAIWRRDTLVAAPFAGRPEGWRIMLTGVEEDFYAALLSH